MSLPNTDYTPPGYQVARACGNCLYYRKVTVSHGTCRLETLANPTAPKRPTHLICTCDAHVFKNHSVTIHRIHHDLNAAIPDDRQL